MNHPYRNFIHPTRPIKRWGATVYIQMHAFQEKKLSHQKEEKRMKWKMPKIIYMILCCISCGMIGISCEHFAPAGPPIPPSALFVAFAFVILSVFFGIKATTDWLE